MSIRSRPGLTLVEMIFGLVIFSIVILGAYTLLNGQLRAFTVGNERMAQLQNFRFAASILEQDIRTMGNGVPGHQPYLVYAGDDVIAFNADYLSNIDGDPTAVYRDLDAPSEMTWSLTVDEQIQLPGTNFVYPQTTYMQSGARSPAETIIFFFDNDPEVADDNVYALFRQVNDLDPEVVARHLRRLDGQPFFSYLRPQQGGDSTGSRLVEFNQSQIPLLHTVPIHGSNADTATTAQGGGPALIDQVRAVRVRYLATTREGGPTDATSAISRIIHLPALGAATARTCGASPIMGNLPVASLEVQEELDEDDNTVSHYLVRVEWEPATDEVEGEQDVNRYIIWRRVLGTSEWGEPIESLRSGEEEYSLFDSGNLVPGQIYEYGVAAQDCTPNQSPIARSNSITIPS